MARDKYNYYVKLALPADERSSEVLRLLEMLRYAGVLIDEPEYLLLPQPAGTVIGGWSRNVIGRAASFGFKCELVRKPK